MTFVDNTYFSENNKFEIVNNNNEEELNISFGGGEAALFSFPLSTFSKTDDFYTAQSEWIYKEGEYGANNTLDLYVVNEDKRINLSYGEFGMMSQLTEFFSPDPESNQSTNEQPLPFALYNKNYIKDIASVDTEMNFTGKTIILPSLTDRNTELTYNLTGPMLGDVNLTINDGGKYDLTMTFDHFYTINTDGTGFTLSDGGKLSDDLETKLSFVKENDTYENPVDIDMILLGDKNIEEVVGTASFSTSNNVVGENNVLNIYSSFGAVRK